MSADRNDVKEKYIIEADHIKELLEVWYKERGKIKFGEYAEPLITRFKKYEVEPKELYIQNMKYW